MRAVKSKSTSIERRLWALLAGYSIRGWKKNPSGIFGKPDVVFPDCKVAVFIDGCFWHGCPDCQKQMPVTNADYWAEKINRNIARASEVNSELRNGGWRVIRIWEHDLQVKEDRKQAAKRVLASIDE